MTTSAPADAPPAASFRALPVNPAALAQRVTQLLRNHEHRVDDQPILLIGAAPVWPHDPLLATRDGLRLRVVPCVSVLGVWEQLAGAHDTPVVVLTDLPEHELGTGILSQVFRRRVIGMEPWSLVAESFGASRLDPRLEAETWAGAALIEATPPQGWPRLAGTVLQRDTALRHLTVERLGLARLDVTPEDLDVTALLRWSALPAGPERLTALSETERAGLLTWLTNEFGSPIRVLTALLATGHAADALPLGLVCATLWSADDPDSLRAQGRVDQYLGGAHLDMPTIRAYSGAATQTMVELLRSDSRHNNDGPVTQRMVHQVLDRAEELLIGFGAAKAGTRSDTLRTGFEHRLGVVAGALARAIADLDRTRTTTLVAARSTVVDLAAHHLTPTYRHRVDRAWMALRLARWLAEGTAAPSGVADGIQRHMAEWAWVDLALEHIWVGEDTHPGLAKVYRTIHDRVSDRRRGLDHAFAEQLAAWTASGGAADETLTVETVLPRVVAPVVRDGKRPVLVVVVDGMSGAVAADLVTELTTQGWTEYDPLGGQESKGSTARRRGAVAGLPTVTSVSRMSLLAGTVQQGGQSDERAAFENHPLWGGRPARLFHKDRVYGDAGEVLHDDLARALSDPDILVGVVVNTVDDALDHGRESADAGWRLSQLGPLRALLDHARYHGRAVILTSDHGHVLDRDSAALPASDIGSARHRTDQAAPRDGEVELVGSRVATDDGRLVACWDPRLRYLPRRAGYHGGVALAEVTVPVVALLPLGAGAPADWRVLGPQQPVWWSVTDSVAALEAPPEPSGTGRRPPRGRKDVKDESADTLFDFSTPAAPGSVVDQLLASEMFKAQQGLTPRRLPPAKIRGALTALLDSNGVLSTTVLAERAGEQPSRAIGFVTTLQRIFNVDNFPILSLTDNGRTVRLDVVLLRQQFGLDEARP